MQRRNFLAHTALALATAGAAPALAQATKADDPVVGAPKIIEALTSKDIVLDRPGTPGQARRPTPRGPAIDLQVQFTFDSAELMPQGKRQLDELAMALNNKALVTAGFMLAGHTDRVGDADYNTRLSLARADSVKVYLAEVHGVSQARLQTIGYGYSRLIDPQRPTAAVNRRVEVRRVAMLASPAIVNSPATQATGGRLVPTPR